MTAGALPVGASSYRPDIDGLRAVSILLVVAFHAGLGAFAGGFVGVDVFFVLSGYLITGLLLREYQSSGTISLRDFYARRARRLLPLSALVIVLTTLAGSVMLNPLARAGLLRDAVAAALYVANWRFAGQATAYSDAEVTDTLLLHYWSLSVEEQFYVMWPVLILLALRRATVRGTSPKRLAGLAVTGVLLASLVASVLQTPSLGVGAYYVTQTRLWEMAAGAALAIAVHGRRGAVSVATSNALALAGLGAILYAAMSFDAATPFPGYAALAPVVGTIALLVAGANRRSAGARVLAWGPLPTLGRWSYAWYLWHWPALGIARLVNESSEQPWPTWLVTAGAVTGSLLLAAGSHYLVENPVRHARLLRTAPRRGLALGASLTVVPAGIAAVLLMTVDTGRAPVVLEAAEQEQPRDATEPGAATPDGDSPAPTADDADPDPPADEDLPELPGMSPAAAAEDTVDIAPDCNNNYRSIDLADGCEFGQPGASTTILLVGDSHAQHWLPALVEATEQYDLRVLSWTMSACPISDTPVYEPRTEGRYLNCERWRTTLLERIERLDTIDLVLVGRSYGYVNLVVDAAGTPVGDRDAVHRAWQEGSARSYERMLASVANVALIADTPWAPHAVPGCLAEHREAPHECDFALEEAAGRDTLLLDAERTAVPELAVLDMTAAVCTDDPCPVVTPDGTVIYRDAHHLTQTYSRQLSDALIRELRRLVPLDEQP